MGTKESVVIPGRVNGSFLSPQLLLARRRWCLLKRRSVSQTSNKDTSILSTPPQTFSLVLRKCSGSSFSSQKAIATLLADVSYLFCSLINLPSPSFLTKSYRPKNLHHHSQAEIAAALCLYLFVWKVNNIILVMHNGPLLYNFVW